MPRRSEKTLRRRKRAKAAELTGFTPSHICARTGLTPSHIYARTWRTLPPSSSEIARGPIAAAAMILRDVGCRTRRMPTADADGRCRPLTRDRRARGHRRTVDNRRRPSRDGVRLLRRTQQPSAGLGVNHGEPRPSRRSRQTAERRTPLPVNEILSTPACAARAAPASAPSPGTCDGRRPATCAAAAPRAARPSARREYFSTPSSFRPQAPPRPAVSTVVPLFLPSAGTLSARREYSSIPLFVPSARREYSSTPSWVPAVSTPGLPATALSAHSAAHSIWTVWTDSRDYPESDKS